MKPWVPVRQAAERLGTSPPTVHHLIKKELLEADKEPRGRGQRFRYRVDEASLNRYLRDHGPLNGRRRSRPSHLERIDRELSSLRVMVDELLDGGSRQESNDAVRAVKRERDSLRAQVVNLEDSLARAADVMELQRKAAAEKAAQVDHLLAAAAAGERVDALQLQIIAEMEEALATFARPGHPGEMA